MFRKFIVFSLLSVATISSSLLATAAPSCCKSACCKKASCCAETKEKSAKAETCAVTGEPIQDISKASSSEHKGQKYYFCCPGCKSKFDAAPEKYTKEAADKNHQESQPKTN